jgi:hypothetical protein
MSPNAHSAEPRSSVALPGWARAEEMVFDQADHTVDPGAVESVQLDDQPAHTPVPTVEIRPSMA